MATYRGAGHAQDGMVTGSRSVEPGPPRAVPAMAAVIAILSLAALAVLGQGIEESFAVHMAFHLVLIGLFAPMLLVCRFFLWWLPENRHTRLDKAIRPLVRGFAALSTPAGAFVISTAVLWFWHIPAFYDATLVSLPLHVIEHLSLLIAFLLFWACLVPGLGAGIPTIATPEGKTLYILAGAMQGMVLGAVITFSGSVIYPYYSGIHHAPGYSALADQETGGAVMWFSGVVVYGVAALLSLLGGASWSPRIRAGTRTKGGTRG